MADRSHDTFEGARVLITGGSSGIGAGLAEAFAAAGATVGIVARRRDRLTEVVERCRAHTPASTMWVADLSDPSAVDRLAEQAVDELGGVDILVNNAGIPKRRHVTALEPATVEAVMAINYLSPVRLTLALLPHMLERGSGTDRLGGLGGRHPQPAGGVGVLGVQGGPLRVLRVHGRRPVVDRGQGGGRLPRGGRHRAVHPSRQRPVRRGCALHHRGGGSGHHPGGGRRRRRSPSTCRGTSPTSPSNKAQDVDGFLAGTAAYVAGRDAGSTG